MSATFDAAYPIVHGHERGIVTQEKADQIHDRGGATKDGVSLRYLREIGFDVDGDGDIDADDVMSLTPDQIKDDVLKRFWLPVYERFSQVVATKIYDVAVNMGTVQAHILAQRASNACGRYLDVDGRLGPKSVAAINDILPNVFVKEMCDQQRLFYEKLLKQKPGMEPCRRGWLARAEWPFSDGRFA